MANYYNLTAWKHTGFDFLNRPYNRDVLNSPYFTDSNNYIQMKGIAVKRDDSSGVTYIDLQGSVKDLAGEQINSPNVTGSLGGGGPWYSWEEVDYIRLSRTGYPGEPDFLDISDNQTDPWNTAHAGAKPVYVSYYFVTGLVPLARNVTRLLLQCDYWLTMGGADELEIEAGYKTRGHITDAEDSAEYNEASEDIGVIHPLIAIGNEILNEDTSGTSQRVIVSTVDLTALTNDGATMEPITITAGNMVYAIPKIVGAGNYGHIELVEPGGKKRLFFLKDIGLFNPNETIVANGLAALYSAGQLELSDSYAIPSQFLDTISETNGKYAILANSVQSKTLTVGKDIGTYPRKADYMYGSMVLYNVGSGGQNIQKFSAITDSTVNIWAAVSPTGNPYARFSGIKAHPYIYDQVVAGMTWVKNAIVMQGASGSLWAQISYAYQQGANARDVATNALSRQSSELNFAQSLVNSATGAVTGGTLRAMVGDIYGAAANVLQSGSNILFASKQQEIARTQSDVSLAGIQEQARQNKAVFAKNTNVAPYADFMPDINKALFTGNEFGVTVINTDSDDRVRLKDYFRRYGYRGLYKPLTWDSIHVKSRVNYIEAENVVLKHAHYPLRDTAKCARLLEQGLFLWNERPNNAAFSEQGDA